MFNAHFRIFTLCAALLAPCVAHQTPANAAPAQGVTTFPEAKQEGPPVRDGERILFRFHAPSDAVKVFLAGSFNAYANNQDSKITDEQFAMTKAGDGFFWTRVFVEPKTQQYKYVVQDKNGQFNWLSDPQVNGTDADGNSVLDFSKVARITASPDREGAPLRDGEQVLFRFHAPADAVKVFLAGSFNNYGNNQDSVVSDEAFAMTQDKNGLYTKRVALGTTIEKYKYVVVSKDGKSTWVADPEVKAVDEDGNTVIDFGKIERVR